MAEADDEELKNFLIRNVYIENGLSNRRNVIAFLELLDSLPIPYEEGLIFSGLTYYPDSEIQTFVIFLRSEIGEIQTFRFHVGGDNGRSIIENSLNGEQLIEVYRSQDGKIIVYSPPKAWNSFPNERSIYLLPVEINGYFITSMHSPRDSNISDITPESIYRNKSVTSIRNVTWIDRNQRGDIFGEGFVTTANAIEILRFVAGLPNDIRSQSAMAAADVNGDGKIDTADALEILRIVAGLHA
jgi:hypothetical protein